MHLHRLHLAASDEAGTFTSVSPVRKLRQECRQEVLDLSKAAQPAAASRVQAHLPPAPAHDTLKTQGKVKGFLTLNRKQFIQPSLDRLPLHPLQAE